VDVRLTNLSQKSRCVAGLETRGAAGRRAGAVALHLATFVTQVDCYTNAPPAACQPM